MAKAEWLRLKAIIVTTTDSVEKERLMVQEKIFPKGQEKKMKAVQREIRDKYMKPLYQKMALVPDSVSEKDVQRDSLHLIHRALIYYKKASLLDD